MKLRFFPLILAVIACQQAFGQTTPERLAPLLGQQVREPEVTVSDLQRYLAAKVPNLPPVPAIESWKAEAAALRRRVLDEVIFHGWPRAWVEAPLKVEDLGVIPSGPGYRIRKLRYEIVPGFYSTALLYEPAVINGKVPAILNVNGHNDPGKALEWKQKRCINQALHGILSLNLEWIYFGELKQPGNVHWFGAHLDLVGANGAGLFYLAMRKGLDYLCQHPNVDRNRIGMTGLSGGGWQTIMLSSLDERVKAAVPVAGYSALISRIERPQDVGDIEQNPTDMLTIADYPLLTAMRAPRPTLLIYNAEDDCCFRGDMVKPYIFDAVRPFFRLFASEDRFAWHLNTDPATHNYQLDNRQQAYRFFTANFGLPVAEKEIDVASQIKSYDELVVGLPEDNLTILGLARRLAAGIRRPASASGNNAEWAQTMRARLGTTVRYGAVELRRAWARASTHSKGLETRAYDLEFTNGLRTGAVWVQALSACPAAPATLVLNDRGREASSKEVSGRVNRGEQVLAMDLLFGAGQFPKGRGSQGFAQLLAGVGERPLGIEAAQVIAAARWLKEVSRAPAVRLEASGIRSQVVALVAAALEPDLFSQVVVHEGMRSLGYLIEKPVEYRDAPDLFCLDLYKEFDIEQLKELAGSAKVVEE